MSIFRKNHNAETCRMLDHLVDIATGVGGRPLRRQLGIALDRQTPALIIGEVPVEDVEFGRSHSVEVAHDGILVLELAGHIEMEATPSPAGFIFDNGTRQCYGTMGSLAIHFGRHQLYKRFGPPCQTHFTAPCDLDSLRVDCETVSFRRGAHGAISKRILPGT